MVFKSEITSKFQNLIDDPPQRRKKTIERKRQKILLLFFVFVSVVFFLKFYYVSEIDKNLPLSFFCAFVKILCEHQLDWFFFKFYVYFLSTGMTKKYWFNFDEWKYYEKKERKKWIDIFCWTRINKCVRIGSYIVSFNE